MDVTITDDDAQVDWECLAALLKNVGMVSYDGPTHRRAFAASYAAVFAFRGAELIGFARVLSDGVYQAALYDLAVRPDFQGQGLGRRLVERLLDKIPDCNMILYASPARESFYKRLGFRRMKTGMARFRKPEAMREAGFTD